MDSEWRYYHLAQVKQHAPDSAAARLGIWEMQADSRTDFILGPEIVEWAWKGIRFFWPLNGSPAGRVLILGVHSDLTFEQGAETAAERLGIIDIIESYQGMIVRDLMAERARLSSILLWPESPEDPAKKLKLYESRLSDESNPTALKLAEAEDALSAKIHSPDYDPYADDMDLASA